MARTFRVAVTSLLLVAALALSAPVASAAPSKTRLKAVIESLSVIDGKSPSLRPLRSLYWLFYWFYD